ncbi:uncharacterized protein LOC132451154 isoform X2 [Gadus macrocephalus]|uniref:uncharacterized protein LOC132451154 isoform X2 n=1 Tax=Gadus macrocephalus TaxID=80720 RepID=UPI0028CB8B80|nr:uncharacterized protein LOC132451154 isoform X2 [Gadus macrocephalus]
MPSGCLVPGCTEKSRLGQSVSFHGLPVKDAHRCKLWLRAINNPRVGEDTGMEIIKGKTICSLHFKLEDFDGRLFGKIRSALKPTAVPSVFAVGPFPGDEQAGASNAPPAAKRSRLQNADSGHCALTLSASSNPLKTFPLTSTPVKTFSSDQGLSTSCPDTPGTLDSSFSTVGEADENYQPNTTVTPTSTSSSEDEGINDWHGKKIIVNESCLMSLFKFCQMCGKPLSSKTVFDCGAQRKVTWTCLAGHSGTWRSSPEVRGMAEVNLLAAAAVEFRGGTYTELSDWCKTMNVQMIAKTTFYEMQKAYLHPAIEDLYQQQRKEIMARVYLEQEDGKKLHLSGDGRCDTPGFSAKYCHYTLMLDDTKEIIHTELLQSTEAGSSVAMEPLGFKRGMNEIMGDGLDIEVMTTDRSTSIRKIMREEFPNVQHEFDIWHTAKGLRKKIQRKGAIKGNEILAAWSRSIINHMWFTCATSKGDTEILKCRWQSILHHVCNEHEWTEDDGQTNRCGHHPLTAQEQSKRQWMKRESSAFENLESLVNDKRLLKDLEQMALFKHTGQPRFNQVFCRRSKQWVVKQIFIPHTTQFIDTLVTSVITRRRNPTIRYKVSTSSLALPQPALPPNIAPVPKPPKEAAVAELKRRF